MLFKSGNERAVFVNSALVLIVAALFLAIFRNAVPHTPFDYDEADYMTVARQGFWANYAEPQSLSLAKFLTIGLKSQQGKISRTGLSDLVRKSNDTGFLRHFHGPLYYHWLHWAWEISGGEYGVRLSGLLCHLLTFATIVMGVPWALGAGYRPAGWLGGAIYLCSLNNIVTATELSSHVLFMWVSMVSLVLIARFAHFPTRRNYYQAVIGAAISLCTLEYGVLLFASLAVALFLRRPVFIQAPSELLRLLAVSLGITLGTIALVWPAALLKGTLPEGFLFIIYLTKFRAGSFGTETPWAVWARRFAFERADCLVLASCFALTAIFLWRSPRRTELASVIVYPLLLLLTTLKNTSDSARYFSSVPAPMIAVGAVLAFEQLRRVPGAVFKVATAALATLLALVVFQPAMLRGADEGLDIMTLRENLGQQKAHKILVPSRYRPSLAYYLPDREILAFMPGAQRPDLVEQIQQNDPDMACVYGWQALPGPVVARVEAAPSQLTCTVRK